MVPDSDEQSVPAPYPSDAAWRRLAGARPKDQDCELPAATVGLFPNIWKPQVFWNPDPNMPPISHPLPPRPEQLELLGDLDMGMGQARLTPGHVAWYLPCQETLVQILFSTEPGQEYRVLEWLDGQGLLSGISHGPGWTGTVPTWVGAETQEDLQTHFIVAKQGHYTTSWTMAFRSWDAWMAQQARRNALAQQQAEGRRCRLVLRLSDALSDYPEPDRFMDRLWVAAGEYGLVAIHWWAPRFEARRVIDSQGPRWERPARPNAMEIDCAHAGSALQYSDRQAEVLPGRTRWRLCVPVSEGNEVAGGGVMSFTADRRFTIEESDAFEQCAGFLARALRGLDERVLMDQQTSVRESELQHSLNALRLEVERTRRNEALQGALFQIARLASEQAHSKNFNEKVHAILGELIRVDTLAILLMDHSDVVDKDLALVYLRNRNDGVNGGRAQTQQISDGVELGVNVAQLGVEPHARLATALAHQTTQRMAPILARDPRKGNMAESWMAAPLLDEGKPIGALCLRASDGHGHDAEDLDILALCAQQVAHAISRQRAVALLEARVAERTHELKEQQEIAEHQAMHDPLTELPNRRHLEQRLEQALAEVDQGHPMVLMFLDLDRFKSVNDEHGHAAGDTVLVESSKRMIQGVRPTDFVARMSGDEFIVIIQPAGDDVPAQTMADRLCKSLSMPVPVGVGQQAQVGCSIGWTRVISSNDITPEELLARADQAMYVAKRGGRGRAVAFDIHDKVESSDPSINSGQTQTEQVGKPKKVAKKAKPRRVGVNTEKRTTGEASEQ